MSEVLPPKRQAAVDRLRRRIDLYAKDHQGRHLHYERIVPTLCEQQMHESFVLKQKYLDPKAKKPSKNKNSGASATGQSSSGSNNSSSGSNSASAAAERKAAPETHAGNTQSNTQSVSKLIDFNPFVSVCVDGW